MKFCLVAPAYNEEGKIGAVVRKSKSAISQLPYEVTVVVVDDASTDRTTEEAREEGAVVLSQPRNQGVGAAIRAGIDYAMENGYFAVAVISGDDQHDPSELGRILGPIVEGKAEFVQGSRWLPGGKTIGIPRDRYYLTKLYAQIMRIVGGFPCTDGTNGLRAFQLSILRDHPINLWQPWLNTYELEPYLLYQAQQFGVNVLEVPCTVIYSKQRHSFSKMKPIKDWWRILRPLILLRLGLRK